MMQALYEQKGAQLDIGLLESSEAQDFISTHASILDSTFEPVRMTDKMRERLTRSDYIFSGLKAFHEMNEAFPSLLDENGDRKPFERFLDDVRKIDETYNANYLHAEYSFVHNSALMAAKWEEYSEDGDRYLLQYRTAHDDKVRPEHAALDGITLPMGDPFWESYYPPNGWNCRCTVEQVRRGKYEETPHGEAMQRGEEVLNGEKLSIFRFNSGKQGKTMPDYNPYTIRRCNDCDVAKGNGVKLAKFIPDNEVCAACKVVRLCQKQNTENTAKATKKAPEVKRFQGTTISNPGFKHDVFISRNSINEWTNQPHKFFLAKNRLLRRIDKVFKNATYIGAIDNYKGTPSVKQSHLFEITLGGEPSWIVVREYDTKEFILHSLSDGEKIKTGLRKR